MLDNRPSFFVLPLISSVAMPRPEILMNKTMTMCTLALGCATLMSSGKLLAQSSSADQDKQFLMTASQSDYTEMKFSQLAVDKATNPRVKSYAQKMITDHTALESEMKPFADKLSVTPVMTLDADHQAKYDALSSMTGMDFDKTYMTGMDVDHHAADAAFKAELSSTTDADLKKTVAKGEKVVAMHTTMADKAVKMMGGTPSSGM